MLELRWGDPVKSYCQWQIPLCLFLSHFPTWPALSLSALHCQCHVPTWPELSLSVLYFDPYFGILVGRTWCHGCVVRTFSARQPSLIVPSISGIYDQSPLVQSVVARVVFLSNRVRSMKCVYFAHSLTYRSVCAMNTPYDPSLGMLPDKSGKLTILKGKSSRLSYREVTISWFTTSSCRSR